MKTEANVNNKGDVTFLAEQRIAGRLILVEGDTRVEAMGGLLHRLVELDVIEGEFLHEQSATKFRKNCDGATLESDCVGEELYSIPVAASR